MQMGEGEIQAYSRKHTEGTSENEERRRKHREEVGLLYM